MFLKRLKLRHRSLGNESGVALVMVIALTTVLMLLISAAFVYALGAQRKSVGDQNWGGALAAAYAGIEEYQSRLAEDSTYLRWGNPAAAFSAGSAVTLPPTTNKAFGIGATGTWASVAVPSDVTVGKVKAEYRYEIDNSKYSNTGTLRIRATGRVGQETRSIVADLRQQGFVDFLYFTDYEIQDPVFSGKATTCVKYAWAGRAATTGGNTCGEIGFGGGDTIAGPAHSNDTLRVCDATFKGPVTTGFNPATGVKYKAADSNGNGCGSQTFELAGYPAYSPVVSMPSTNSQLRRETRSDLTGSDVPRPGCLYTGPTSITLNSNGTVTVKSPWTIKTRITGDPATGGSTPADCGDIAAMKTAAGSTFTPPANNVLYVQNVPATAGNPNYWASNAQPNANSCKGAAAPIAANTPAGNGLGYPLYGEDTSDTPYAYECRNGDLFVSGSLDGAMTLGSEHYVYVVGDIKYMDANDDMLGIVGQDAVFVWTPVSNTNASSPMVTNTNRRIDAAILSVGHTFMVQNYTSAGNRGTLTVNGAIAQKFRGTVRSNPNGYIKNYVYDTRLRYTAPPKFLSPVSTTYGVNVWIEVKPAFKPTGAAN